MMEAFPDLQLEKKIMKFRGRYDPEVVKDNSFYIKVPCGKCLGCKLDYSRQWADRMILELADYNGKGLFCTLTYNPEHLPPDSELCKRDLQLFFKRLRRHWPYVRIRYYASGEYGRRTLRPHYHAIIFGLSLEDLPDRRKVGTNELGQDYFTSQEFCDRWSDQEKRPLGFVCLSDVSYKTCAYVARYCAKKAFSPSSQGKKVKEFAVMSRDPGIGKNYFDVHKDEIFPKDGPVKSRFYLSDSEGSVRVSLPPYFLKQLKLTDPELYDKITLERGQFSLDRDLLKLQSTELDFIEMSEVEYNELLNKTKILFNREEDF